MIRPGIVASDVEVHFTLQRFFYREGNIDEAQNNNTCFLQRYVNFMIGRRFKIYRSANRYVDVK